MGRASTTPDGRAAGGNPRRLRRWYHCCRPTGGCGVTWTKLSDDFTDDCDQLSDNAFRLHVEGLCWSNRKLLDCLIPKEHLRRFATRPDSVAELVATGWWSDEGDHYAIEHHACYQKTRAEVVARQKRNQENGAKGGRPPGPPREVPPRKRRETHVETQVETDVGSRKEIDNPDGLASGNPSGLTKNGKPQVKTQVGYPDANPEGRAGRSSKGNHLQKGNEAETLCRDCLYYCPENPSPALPGEKYCSEHRPALVAPEKAPW